MGRALLVALADGLADVNEVKVASECHVVDCDCGVEVQVVLFDPLYILSEYRIIALVVTRRLKRVRQALVHF